MAADQACEKFFVYKRGHWRWQAEVVVIVGTVIAD